MPTLNFLCSLPRGKGSPAFYADFSNARWLMFHPGGTMDTFHIRFWQEKASGTHRRQKRARRSVSSEKFQRDWR